MLDKPIITVSCNEDITASDLIGRFLLDSDGTRWIDGPLTIAARHGAICYLDEVVEAVEVGSEAPDFTLTDTEGNEFNLSDYEGEKVVILDFMFTTCVPCEKFVKDSLGPYAEEMDKDEVAIISISVFDNDDEAKLRDYAKNHNWRHAMGDPNGDIEISYGVEGTPKIFIID